MRSSSGRGTAVIGLGNPLMADDGMGVLAIQRLQQEWTVPSDVEMIDGGTWGMTLLPLIEGTERLLLLDAIDRGQPPGTLIALHGDEIPRVLSIMLSPHQIDLREVIAVATLRGRLPGEMIALGLQPERVIFEPSLSTTIEQQLDRLVSAAAEQLARWGHVCVPRTSGVGA